MKRVKTGVRTEKGLVLAIAKVLTVVARVVATVKKTLATVARVV